MQGAEFRFLDLDRFFVTAHGRFGRVDVLLFGAEVLFELADYLIALAAGGLDLGLLGGERGRFASDLLGVFFGQELRLFQIVFSYL